MSYESILNKVVINFLHYHNNKSVEEATLIYNRNKQEFEIVADLLGMDFVIGLLESIVVKQTKKSKGKKNE